MPTVHETWDRYLGESGDHLHLVAAYGFSYFEFHIFDMEADYSNWFLKDKLHLDAKTYVLVPMRGEDLIRSYLLS